ncbi:MAG: flagellar FlbD family protein [Clostridiales bacterium]|nr:flagellar FlbD family protein [Clostridiales bacterium]
MITLKKMNNTSITINSDYIFTIEETPDTVITFCNDKKIIVKESRKEILELIMEYKKQCK